MLIILFLIERVFKTINYVLKEGDIKLIVDEELNKSDKKGQRDVNEPNSLKCSWVILKFIHWNKENTRD